MKNSIDLKNYQENGEWQIIGMSMPTHSLIVYFALIQ